MDPRPYFFICPMWGAAYREMFVKFCAASLLAPGNIPSLLNKSDSRFIIPTTPEDWEALQSEPIIDLLKEHIGLDFIDLTQTATLGTTDDTKYTAASKGYIAGADRAFKAKAYGMFLAPDMMLSDGALKFLQQKTAEGKKLILSSALRFNQEEFAEKLTDAGYVRPGEALSLQPRELMRMALPHLHPESIGYDWANPYYSDFSFCAFWRMPKDQGIILHSHNWAIMSLDFAEIEDHDTTDLEKRTIDAAYANDNFGPYGDHIHVVNDTDEFAYVSFTPHEEMNKPLKLNPIRDELLAGMHFGSFLNPLHREIFRIPIFMHTDDLTPAWHKKAEKVSRELDRTLVKEFPKGPVKTRWRYYRANVRCRAAIVLDLFRASPRYTDDTARTLPKRARAIAALLYYTFFGNYVLSLCRRLVSLPRRALRRTRDVLMSGLVNAKEKSKLVKAEGELKRLKAAITQQEIAINLKHHKDPFYVQVEPNAFHDSPEDKQVFDELFGEYKSDPVRIVMLINLMKAANSLPEGDFVELGTHQGLMARMIFRLMRPECALYLFDTFEGFDPRDTAVESDKFQITIDADGGFAETSMESVSRNVGGGEIPENVHCIQGWFPESFSGYEDKKWRFIHLDFDLYQPTLEALTRLWPNLVPGGVLMVHDYGCSAFAGIKDAVDEYFATVSLTPIILADTFGTAVVIKPLKAQSVD